MPPLKDGLRTVHVSGSFLHTCLYVMRYGQLKMLTADGQSIFHENGHYRIGSVVVPEYEAMNAIEYYYKQNLEALEEDEPYIRRKARQLQMRSRQEVSS